MASTGLAVSQKLCFVTLGATADFFDLLKAVCDVEFVKRLHQHGYTELRIQFGKGGSKIFSEFVSNRLLPSRDTLMEQVSIIGFDFHDSLSEDMRMAKGGIAGYKEGVIISHAGGMALLMEDVSLTRLRNGINTGSLSGERTSDLST